MIKELGSGKSMIKGLEGGKSMINGFECGKLRRSCDRSLFFRVQDSSL